MGVCFFVVFSLLWEWGAEGFWSVRGDFYVIVWVGRGCLLCEGFWVEK